jgi:hypothetical protein
MLINKVIRFSIEKPCFLLRLKNNDEILKPYFSKCYLSTNHANNIL